MNPRPVVLIRVAGVYAELFASWCRPRDIPLTRAEDGALMSATDGSIGLCVLALAGDWEDAFEMARSAFKAARGAPVVVLLERPTVELVVRLVRLGISDVLELPAPPRDVLAKAMQHFADSGQPLPDERFVGQSPAIRGLRDQLQRASRGASTVLIEGETGTGKGVLARQIHAQSPRKDRPFVHVDCAALSPTLIESELFGHEKGAFTGAAALRRGRFESAADGTIFLDEIGDLEPRLQTKLLRVLEDRQFERVGGTRAIFMRARVIAATSHDLYRAVAQNSFRRDLYFRLNVLHFVIPPLRERLDDVPLLVQDGLERLATRLNVPIPRVSEEFYEYLSDYDWPGNVRELMNVLERILVHRRVEELIPEDLDEVLDFPATPPASHVQDRADSGEPGASDEAEQIVAAIRDTGGNIARAARRLGIARGTLRYRIKKFGLRHLIPND